MKIEEFFLWSILKGMKTSLKALFKQKVTIRYPFEKTPLSPKFCGQPMLRRTSKGNERCQGCKLCEAICPSKAISIVIKTNAKGHDEVSFAIDLTKCMYCGLCQKECPREALVESANFEYATYTKEELYYTKEKLLDIGDRWEEGYTLQKKEKKRQKTNDA